MEIGSGFASVYVNVLRGGDCPRRGDQAFGGQTFVFQDDEYLIFVFLFRVKYSVFSFF